MVDTDGLRSLDSDIQFQVRSIISELDGLKSGQATLALESGHLRLQPAFLDFHRGNLRMAMDLDLNETPSIIMTLEGNELDPWAALHLTREKGQVQADVDLSAHLETTGRSPRELAKNASGQFHIDAKNGRIRTTMLNFLFVDLIGWATNLTTGKYQVASTPESTWSLVRILILMPARFSRPPAASAT